MLVLVCVCVHVDTIRGQCLCDRPCNRNSVRCISEHASALVCVCVGPCVGACTCVCGRDHLLSLAAHIALHETHISPGGTFRLPYLLPLIQMLAINVCICDIFTRHTAVFYFSFLFIEQNTRIKLIPTPFNVFW